MRRPGGWALADARLHAWVEGPQPVREVTWHDGLGVLYRLWEGDDPRKAHVRAGKRHGKRREKALK